MSSKYDVSTRIVVLGTAGNGKTALVVKLLSGRFIWDYDPTLEGLYKHRLIDEDEDGEQEVLHLEVMDTAGFASSTDGNQIVKEGYMKWADAFLLVYSITDRASFEAVKSLRDEIAEQKRPDSTIAIVGNKADLNHVRQVEKNHGTRLADDNGCVFCELSAKDDRKMINRLFVDICKEVKARKTRDGVKLRRRSSASQILRKLIQKKLNV